MLCLYNMEAITVARIFVNEFICRFGAPEQLHTDQGRNFELALLRDLQVAGNHQDSDHALSPSVRRDD